MGRNNETYHELYMQVSYFLSLALEDNHVIDITSKGHIVTATESHLEA